MSLHVNCCVTTERHMQLIGGISVNSMTSVITSVAYTVNGISQNIGLVTECSVFGSNGHYDLFALVIFSLK